MIRALVAIILIYTVVYAGLSRPYNGEDLNHIHIYFEWEQEPDAVSYNIQVSDQQSFNNLVIDNQEISTAYIGKNNINWDSAYYWRVRPIFDGGAYGSWIDESFFTIGNKILPDLDINIYNNELIQDGLNIYTQFIPNVVVGVIDRYGNEIWSMENIFMNHVNEFGQIYGVNGPGIEFNYDQDILFQTPINDVDAHEVKQIFNGNYMAFVPDYSHLGPIHPGEWSFLFQSQGYQVDGVTNEFPYLAMRIVEWDSDGNEVWDWNPFEHFSMEDTDLYGGMWWDAAMNGRYDWMHSNAFHFDDEESVIYVSHRHLSRISKIAYPSGEVIWNMGLPEEYSTGDDNICTDLLFSFQHHIQLMDDGSLLFFDNGNISDILTSDNSPITRIRRVVVIDDSSCETIWQYDLPPSLHGLGMGSVQELDNGNYSIYTYGNGLNNPECSIFEITPSGDMVWKATSQDQNSAWYRSYKIPSIHPQAFSIVVDGYTNGEDGDYIEIPGDALNFTIYNKSGYDLEYRYMFGDMLDGGPQLFTYDEGVVEVPSYGSEIISFPVSGASDLAETQVMLSIWPVHHEYALKQLEIPVVIENITGDINGDSIINILDVIQLVGFSLGGTYQSSGDINSDGVINILDIVQLVNIILN